MSKPSILLVTGSFAPPSIYDNIVDSIKAKGYEMRALHSPSVGLSPKTGREIAPPTMYDDAALIAKEVKRLADDGKDVLLIGHSYGGVPVTQSTQGLGKEERRKAGKNGGVARIAYMTCLVPEVGVAAAGVLASVVKEPDASENPSLQTDEKGWMYFSDEAATAATAFSDLPLEEGTAWVGKFAKHSAISFTNELTYAGYMNIPVSYLFCEKDLSVPVEIQRSEIDMIERVSGKKVDVTSIDAGHCPSISKPQEVIDWILKVAEKV